MKVPLSWLREFVDVDVPASELARRLTMVGLEVEDVRIVGSNWTEVRLARVLDLQAHPRLDNLTVAQLDLGDRRHTVVTGARNLQVGDVVPHVAPGGRLPGGDVGTRTFSGITSEGMVCSGDELDISPDKDGIYVMEPSAPVGEPLDSFLDEAVLDIYVTANRPDCMSVIGIAREVHAIFGVPYKRPFLRLMDPATARVDGTPGEPPVRDLLTVRIEDAVGCPRFSASVVRDIAIGPSPQWLQRRLHFAGVRPISNVVDVTNYVMLEVGQPLHAFDRQRLNDDTIVVRRARDGEPLKTLDGEEHRLKPTMMVVADQQRARSLAGIMGGEDSEIADTTREVVLEGASWDRASVRLASSALLLASEASRRFGRGVDPDLTGLGVARATELTLELAGGRAAVGIVDEYPGREPQRAIDIRPAQIDALLGTHYSDDQVLETLDALGFAVDATAGADALRVTVPGWRRFDVEGRPDLAEEVARIIGYEIVPPVALQGALPAPRPDGDHGFGDEQRARRALAAAGLQEVITYSLVDPDLGARLSADPDAPVEPAVRIANPMSAEASVLRTSLLGSLLGSLRNTLRQRDRVLLFELARTWHERPTSADGQAEVLPDERRHVGLAIAGRRLPSSWSTSNELFDFYDVKGMLEALLGAFRVSARFAPARHPSLHPGRAAEVCGGDLRLGYIGQLHPTVAERFDLDGVTVLVAELDFERLLSIREPLLNVQTPSRFPPADRDIAIVVDVATPHGDVEVAVREAGAPLLESVRLFDVYTGGSIPTGRKSLAFALRYRAPDRTLADDEVSVVHARVEDLLRTRFNGEVRGR